MAQLSHQLSNILYCSDEDGGLSQWRNGKGNSKSYSYVALFRASKRGKRAASVALKCYFSLKIVSGSSHSQTQCFHLIVNVYRSKFLPSLRFMEASKLNL